MGGPSGDASIHATRRERSFDREGLRTLALALPGQVLLVVLAAMAWGYVKDDAWISFRYAYNLVHGQGMVFNPGERIEGYTNFLWTMLMAPFMVSSLDPMPFAAVLGIGFTAVAVAATVAMVRQLGGAWYSALGAGLAYVSWMTVPVWAGSGLEMGMVQAFCALGLWAFLRAWRTERPRDWLWMGAWMALACLTRPDAHAVAGLAVLVALGARRAEALPAVVSLLGITAPYHLWRVLYFGDLFPSTFLVKGGSGFQYLEWGVRYVGEMLRFGHMWLMLALAAVGLGLVLWKGGDRGRHDDRWWAVLLAAIPLVFLVYMAKVATDELRWFRLFLPAWPAVVTLAMVVPGRLAAEGCRAWLRAAPLLVAGAFVAISVAHATGELPDQRGYSSSSRRNHADVAKFLTRHSAPGESVAFQDMGSTPFHAPDLTFIDPVGLVDPFFADLHQRHRVNPFLKDYWRKRADGREHLEAMYREGREHLIQRDPEWVIYVARVGVEEGRALTRTFRRAPDANPVDDHLGPVSLYCHWADDPRFHARYVHVRTWRRSDTYWLTVWRRRDLWEQPPAEVVIDEPPDGLGPAERLDDGTTFLGARVEPTAHVAGEVWVESYLLPTGPRRTGTVIDLRFLDNGRVRYTETHVPGDWMWPAERWVGGETVRDRVLVQLPGTMEAGVYDVQWRLRHRPSHAPVGVAGDEQGWLPVGEVELVDRGPLDWTRIERTDVEEQRAGPEAWR